MTTAIATRGFFAGYFEKEAMTGPSPADQKAEAERKKAKSAAGKPSSLEDPKKAEEKADRQAAADAQKPQPQASEAKVDVPLPATKEELMRKLEQAAARGRTGLQTKGQAAGLAAKRDPAEQAKAMAEAVATKGPGAVLDMDVMDPMGEGRAAAGGFVEGAAEGAANIGRSAKQRAEDLGTSAKATGEAAKAAGKAVAVDLPDALVQGDARNVEPGAAAAPVSKRVQEQRAARPARQALMDTINKATGVAEPPPEPAPQPLAEPVPQAPAAVAGPATLAPGEDTPTPGTNQQALIDTILGSTGPAPGAGLGDTPEMMPTGDVTADTPSATLADLESDAAPVDVPVPGDAGGDRAALQGKIQELTGGPEQAGAVTPEWVQPSSPINPQTGEPTPISPAFAADTPSEASPNREGLWDTIKEYAPYVAGGAAVGGLGSALADKLQGVEPRMRKAMIVMALTGGVGALLKATGGLEGLQGGGSTVV